MSSSGEKVMSAKIIIKHRYSEPWDDSDVILVVEDEKFHVHSNILGFASPVFKTMFSSDFKEGKEKMVNLPGKDRATILTMLNVIYPIEFRITEYSCCESLLELAREYDIKRITQIVDDWLLQNVSCSLKVLTLAEKYLLTRTQIRHVEYFSQKYDTPGLTFKGDWNNVSDRTKFMIVSIISKRLKVDIFCGKCGTALSNCKDLKMIKDACHAFNR